MTQYHWQEKHVDNLRTSFITASWEQTHTHTRAHTHTWARGLTRWRGGAAVSGDPTRRDVIVRWRHHDGGGDGRTRRPRRRRRRRSPRRGSVGDAAVLLHRRLYGAARVRHDDRSLRDVYLLDPPAVHHASLQRQTSPSNPTSQISYGVSNIIRRFIRSVLRITEMLRIEHRRAPNVGRSSMHLRTKSCVSFKPKGRTTVTHPPQNDTGSVVSAQISVHWSREALVKNRSRLWGLTQD